MKVTEFFILNKVVHVVATMFKEISEPRFDHDNAFLLQYHFFFS
jgi:hypothetical protein